MCSDTSELEGDDNGVSPLTLAGIELRLLHNEPSSPDSIRAVIELIALGKDAIPLVPLLCQLYRP